MTELTTLADVLTANINLQAVATEIIEGGGAYAVYLDNTTDNPELTEVEWLASLNGKDGLDGEDGEDGLSDISQLPTPPLKLLGYGTSDVSTTESYAINCSYSDSVFKDLLSSPNDPTIMITGSYIGLQPTFTVPEPFMIWQIFNQTQSAPVVTGSSMVTLLGGEHRYLSQSMLISGDDVTFNVQLQPMSGVTGSGMIIIDSIVIDGLGTSYKWPDGTYTMITTP